MYMETGLAPRHTYPVKPSRRFAAVLAKLTSALIHRHANYQGFEGGNAGGHLEPSRQYNTQLDVH